LLLEGFEAEFLVSAVVVPCFIAYGQGLRYAAREGMTNEVHKNG
jgi:hypothetical protein